MVYIDRDGRVVNQRSWNLTRVAEIFSGIWFIIVQFFLTLVAPFRQGNRRTLNNQGNNGWGPGGGGGSGSGRSGGRNNSNGDFHSSRRIGRVVNTSMDCNIPGGG